MVKELLLWSRKRGVEGREEPSCSDESWLSESLLQLEGLAGRRKA